MRALVVDDDFGSRVGMISTLSTLYPNSELYEAKSIEEAMAVLAGVDCVALVLLDLNLEGTRGIDTLRTLKQWCKENDCNPRIVVVSAAADYDIDLIPEAIENCATGFITKGTSIQVFKSAVDLTLAGSIYIPERYLPSRRKGSASGAPEAETSFTPRENQVAALLVQGLSYKQIARRLSDPGRAMSDNIVRVHVQRIAWKLRVTHESGGESLSAKAAVLTAFADRRLKFAPQN